MDSSQTRGLSRERETARVRVTKRQQAHLFNELRLHDELKYTLHDGALVGSVDALAQVARKLEDSAAVAATLEQAQRLTAMRGVLSRLAKAGIVAASRDEQAREGVTGSGSIVAAPESQFIHAATAKPLHPSKIKRFERYWGSSKVTWTDGEYHVEDVAPAETSMRLTELRPGRRARVSKKPGASLRADTQRGFVRGDRVFSHDEIVRTRVEGVTVGSTVITANDENVTWLRAGSNPGDGAASISRTREGVKSCAAQRVALPKAKRIAATVDIVLAKRGKARPSWVSYAMAQDDIRVGRYEFRSDKHKATQRRYTVWAQQWLAKHPVETNRQVTFGPESVAVAAKQQPIERLFVRCDHEYRVSPKRTQRTCECCGEVARKRNGRWAITKPGKEVRRNG